MKCFVGLFSISFLFSFLLSCNSPTNSTVRAAEYSSELGDMYKNTPDEKVFRFGNKNAKKNVLLLLGVDLYVHRVLNREGYNDPFEEVSVTQRLLNYCNGSNSYKKGDGVKAYYQWKKDDTLFNVNDCNFLVIVTNNEENILSDIVSYSKRLNMIFDYFIFSFHGSPDSIDSDFKVRSLSRADILEQLDSSENIKKCFTENCDSIILSCSVLSDDLPIPFAVFMRVVTGIRNMSASKSLTYEVDSPGYIFERWGEFQLVTDTSVEKLKSMALLYRQYAKSEDATNEYGSSYASVVVNLPKTLLSTTDIDTSNMHYLGSAFNSSNNQSILYYLSDDDQIIVQTWQYEIDTQVIVSQFFVDASFTDFLKFVFDVNQRSTIFLNFN